MNRGASAITGDVLGQLCSDLLIDIAAIGSVCVAASGAGDPTVVVFLAAPAEVADAARCFAAAGRPLSGATAGDDTIDAWLDVGGRRWSLYVTTERHLAHVAASAACGVPWQYSACTIVASRSRVVARLLDELRAALPHAR